MAASLVLGWAYRFVSAAVRGRPRVLEVGCGEGALAERLARAGHSVTAVDRDLSGLEPAPGSRVRFVEADFLRFESEPFDAVVFGSSLHHVFPLDAALGRAAALLVPGGALVVDELDVEACDEATAAFRYASEARLADRGLVAPASGPVPAASALERWRREHEHVPPLHGGEAMLAAIRRRFEGVRARRVPYLFRYACAELDRTPAGVRAGQALLAAERRAVDAGRIRPLGLRIVARGAT